MPNELLSIADLPTVHNGTHESIYRCYYVLKAVEQWLIDGVPPKTILNWMEALQPNQSNRDSVTWRNGDRFNPYVKEWQQLTPIEQAQIRSQYSYQGVESLELKLWYKELPTK